MSCVFIQPPIVSKRSLSLRSFIYYGFNKIDIWFTIDFFFNITCVLSYSLDFYPEFLFNVFQTS